MNFMHPVSKVISGLTEEVRLRISTFNKYKAKIQQEIKEYFEEYRQNQQEAVENAQLNLQHRILSINNAYDSALASLAVLIMAIYDPFYALN